MKIPVTFCALLMIMTGLAGYYFGRFETVTYEKQLAEANNELLAQSFYKNTSSTLMLIASIYKYLEDDPDLLPRKLAISLALKYDKHVYPGEGTARWYQIQNNEQIQDLLVKNPEVGCEGNHIEHVVDCHLDLILADYD